MATNRNQYFSSFMDFHPFNRDGSPKKGVVFTDWKQNEKRHGIMAYSRDMVHDAFWFYTDASLSLKSAIDILEASVLSEKDFEDKVFNPWRDKNAERIGRSIDRFWTERAPSKICATDGMPQLDNMKAICAEEKLRYGSLSCFLADPISKNHGEYHKFEIHQEWGISEYCGTGAYVRGEIKDYPKLAPSTIFSDIVSSRYGLKAITSPLAPTRPFSTGSADSLFGWSVSGGTGCGGVAVNLASGVVVPLDNNNNISNHKHGWSYAHKYMGSHGHTGLMVIMRKYGELDFGLSDEILKIVGNGDLSAGKAKVTRYLCALLVLAGWPVDAAVSINCDEQAEEIIPQEVIGQ